MWRKSEKTFMMPYGMATRALKQRIDLEDVLEAKFLETVSRRIQNLVDSIEPTNDAFYGERRVIPCLALFFAIRLNEVL